MGGMSILLLGGLYYYKYIYNNPSNDKPKVKSSCCNTEQKSSCCNTEKQSSENTSYNNYNSFTKHSSGCIDGEGFVLMANGQRKKVCDIKSGEYVRSFPNCVSMVECVMISKIGKEIKMVKLENSNDGTHFWITYKHPILVDNDTVMIDHDICNNLSVDSLDVDVVNKYNLKWVFPKTICTQKLKFESMVYNFLLDSNHTINVNGYWCVTLGDDYDKGDGIGHQLWGNSVAVRKFLNHKSKD
eukprot:350928_1